MSARPPQPPSELRVLYRSARKALADHIKDLAAAIAYYAFFSIFPLLIAVIAAAGQVLKTEAAQAKLRTLLTETLPGSADLVMRNVDDVVEVRGALGVFGLLALFWSASACFGAITRAVNRALGAKRPHPFFLSKVRSFLMTVAASLLFIASVAVTTSVEVLTNLEDSVLVRLGIDPGVVSWLAGGLTGLVFAFFTFLVIYKTTPYVETRWKQALPGAILGAVLFEVGKHAFVFYLGSVAHFEAVYGPLSSIIVLLLWLYFSALILVFGAEYNIVRWRARHGDTRSSGDREP